MGKLMKSYILALCLHTKQSKLIRNNTQHLCSAFKCSHASCALSSCNPYNNPVRQYYCHPYCSESSLPSEFMAEARSKPWVVIFVAYNMIQYKSTQKLIPLSSMKLSSQPSVTVSLMPYTRSVLLKQFSSAIPKLLSSTEHLNVVESFGGGLNHFSACCSDCSSLCQVICNCILLLLFLELYFIVS